MVLQRFVQLLAEGHARALREEARKFTILAEIKDYVIPAGQTRYLPDEGGVDVSGYSKKTISFLFDTELEYVVEISDDRVNWIGMHPVEKRESAHPWFEADVFYTRLRIHNPLTTDQRVIYCSIKGRRLG